VGIVLLVAGVTGQSMSTPIRAVLIAVGIIFVMKKIGSGEKGPYKVSDEQYKKITSTKKYSTYLDETINNHSEVREARKNFLSAYGPYDSKTGVLAVKNISNLDTSKMSPSTKLAYNTYLIKHEAVKKRNALTDKQHGKSYGYYVRKKSKKTSSKKITKKSRVVKSTKKRSNK